MMCIAIPAQLVEVRGSSGWVDIGGCKREVRLDLVDAAKEGEYVIVHAGFAIHKIDKEQAGEMLGLMGEQK
jgi:hydrogenase expression/formation protein HypC